MSDHNRAGRGHEWRHSAISHRGEVFVREDTITRVIHSEQVFCELADMSVSGPDGSGCAMTGKKMK